MDLWDKGMIKRHTATMRAQAKKPGTAEQKQESLGLKSPNWAALRCLMFC